MQVSPNEEVQKMIERESAKRYSLIHATEVAMGRRGDAPPTSACDKFLRRLTKIASDARAEYGVPMSLISLAAEQYSCLLVQVCLISAQ